MTRPIDTELATMSWFDLRREAERARAAELNLTAGLDQARTAYRLEAESVLQFGAQLEAERAQRAELAERARVAETRVLKRLAHASQELHQRSGHDGTWAECPRPTCAGDRELMPAKPLEERCAECGSTIDPTTCWCGSCVDGHGYEGGHSAVPMGCICHRR